MDTNTRYIDIHGICTRYTIKRRTVWRWVNNGILPSPTYFAGPGSGARWPIDELERRDSERDAERKQQAGAA